MRTTSHEDAITTFRLLYDLGITTYGIALLYPFAAAAQQIIVDSR